MDLKEDTLMFLLFFVFLYSLCPTIYVGDSSLFSTASFSLGTAHPPGYPLFVILGKLMTFIPFGNVGFRTNLVCAVSGALACLMVYKTSMAINGNRAASWAAALLCGISPLFFEESLKAEVYTLNSFLCMLVFYLGIRILKEDKDFVRLSLLGFFLLGLGTGNHHTIGFAGLVFLLPLCVRWRQFRVGWFFFALLFFAAGFSVNLLLYLRAVAMDQSRGLFLYSYAGTWDDFVKVLLRKAYQGASTPETLLSGVSSGRWYYGLKNSMVHVALYSMGPMALFFVLGLWKLRRQRMVLAYFIFSFVIWFGLLGKMVWSGSSLTNDDIEIISVYFLPAVPVIYSIVATGFAFVIDFVSWQSFQTLSRAIPYVIAALPLVFYPYSFKMSDLQKDSLAYEYGRDLLTVLPVKSMLLNYSDNAMFISFYMRTVERFREDLLAIGTAGREDVYGLETSPQWKYSGLFPEFYQTRKSTVRQINKEFALREKLFANNPRIMSEVVDKFYAYYPYVFSVALWPKGTDAREFKEDIRKRFLSEYNKVNYESVAAQPVHKDFLEEELVTAYSLHSLIYADLLKREGDESTGDAFYNMAFSMGNPRKFLWPYIRFLVGDGQEKEAFALLGKLKTAGGEEGKFAEFLESKALLVISGEKEKISAPKH